MKDFFTPISTIADDSKIVLTSKKITVLPHNQFVTTSSSANVFFHSRLEYGTVDGEHFYKITGKTKEAELISDSFPTFEEANNRFEERFIKERKSIFRSKTVYAVSGKIYREFDAEVYIKASTIERVIHWTKLISSSISN